jgi:hypothetical protein
MSFAGMSIETPTAAATDSERVKPVSRLAPVRRWFYGLANEVPLAEAHQATALAPFQELPSSSLA